MDHMVIGHNDRGALARWLVGSVSHEILNSARVPVTIVH
ncbi:universal stress protein [Oleiagrimonas sp.]|nr:universal stress protein [Oleiagrimonas sp.]MDA3913475.1 universal stress protein [Oleiagrimonas sp.]